MYGPNARVERPADALSGERTAHNNGRAGRAPNGGVSRAPGTPASPLPHVRVMPWSMCLKTPRISTSCSRGLRSKPRNRTTRISSDADAGETGVMVKGPSSVDMVSTEWPCSPVTKAALKFAAASADWTHTGKAPTGTFTCASRTQTGSQPNRVAPPIRATRSCVRTMASQRQTLALSDRTRRPQARGRRRMEGMPEARPCGAHHGPLGRVIRPLPPRLQWEFGHLHPSNTLMLCVGPRPRSGWARLAIMMSNML